MKSTQEGDSTHYFEGGVFHDAARTETSTFNLLAIDLEERRQRFARFELVDGNFNIVNETDWRPMRCHVSLDADAFRLNESFVEQLREIGANFKHPRKTGALNLLDTFIWPDLRDTASRPESKLFATVKGEDLASRVLLDKRLVLIGRDKIGKSALLNMLHAPLSKERRVLMMSGDSLTSPTETKIQEVIRAEVTRQYSSTILPTWNALLPNERLLLLDNYHRIPFNGEGKSRILHILAGLFGSIVVTVDDEFGFEEVMQGEWREKQFPGFKRLEIMELGHNLREKLISKWYRLGNEYSSEPEDLSQDIRQAHSFVSTVLGKNLIPSFPIFTLILIQQFEAGKSTPTANGSFGYMYEFLITEALGQSRFKEAPIGTKYNYLSHIAYAMHTKEGARLSMIELEDLHRDFIKFHALRFSFQGSLEDFKRANILASKADGVRFKYRYLYYYFVARYYARNPRSEPDLHPRLIEMSRRLYNEEYANVIIFYCYLKPDLELYNEILRHARSLYSNHAPCDLDSSVPLIAGAQRHLVELSFHSESVEATRRDLLDGKDDDASDSQDASQIADAISLTDAIKTIQILGQILRNFSGDLSSALKEEMALECYNLGMRLLTYFTTLICGEDKIYLESVIRLVIAEHKLLQDDRALRLRERLQSAGNDVAAVRRKRPDPTPTPTLSRSEVVDRASEEVGRQFHNICFAIIRRISDAVGSQHLMDTYASVLAAQPSVSFKLIDASIRLDHASPFPVSEVVDLGTRLKRENAFGYGILRHLVFLNLYLYTRGFRVRQQLCEGLDIGMSQRFVSGAHKRSR